MYPCMEYYYEMESMCSVHGEIRNAYKIVIINLEVKILWET
jgi:hypothetical protein